MTTLLAPSVRATLNFAANRNDGGRHCNTDDSKTFLELDPHEVTITDARGLESAPRFDREGFVLADHPVADPQWFDEDWIDAVYAQTCNDLVKRLTGARETLQFHRPLKRIVDPDVRGEHMHTAGFVHVDHPREVGLQISEMFAGARGLGIKRGTLFNVWKAITPPPQDRPLTVADRRTVPTDAHVVGVTVDEGGDVPYVIMAHDERMKFYYFSNMTADESIVFTGIDFDADNPLGCAHSAFLHPDSGVSRSSIESRVIAIYE